MKSHCIYNLEDLEILLSKMNTKLYTFELKSLSGATIGQHFRHILELYQCLLSGIDREEINYDSRVRDKLIENEISVALDTIGKIKKSIGDLTSNRILTLKGNYACEKDGEINIITSLYRELAYNLEHSIHHQALIRVGLMELNSENLITDSFGVAPSTLRFRNELMLGN